MLNRLTVARDSVRAMIDATRDLTFEPTIEAAAAALTRRTTAAESAIEAVDLALEVGGGAADATGPGIERLHRDVLGARDHPCRRVARSASPGASPWAWIPSPR